MKDFLFPFKEIRQVQDELIKAVSNALDKKENLVVHAPTGLGKTVSALGPALRKAVDENLTVFFLTSRHTQHKIAIDTLKDIKKKYNLNIPVVDIIGKKHMCLQPGISLLHSNEFFDYCKNARENRKCEFFNNLKDSKLSIAAKDVLNKIDKNSPMEVGELISLCDNEKLCPYEISLIFSK